MQTYDDRGKGIQTLLFLLTDVNKVAKDKPPCLVDKIKVIVMGKHKDYTIFANGNVWIPEKKATKKFIDVIGEEVSIANAHLVTYSHFPVRHAGLCLPLIILVWWQ